MEFALRESDFAAISKRVRDLSGIVLSDRKRELVYNRLVRRLRALRLQSFREYCELLEGEGGETEAAALINAITTNLTSFFREKHHFAHLARSVLAPAIDAGKRGRRRLRFWSAACSTGEEPYSIGMVLSECLSGQQGWDAKILATDIDTNVLAHAEKGIYPIDALSTIPAAYADKYVTRTEQGDLSIAAEIRGRISFKQLNLFDDWPVKGPFEAIFCRNVFIYFDKKDQAKIANRFADLLQPKGWLYIGHSESLQGHTEKLVLAGQTIYQRAQ